MKSLRSIIRADYLQRTRSYAFLITLMVTLGLAYAFVPPAGANYATVRIGEYVGENNAAWIGHVTAIMSSTFLWLFGFYLVNNGIRRDEETGVGQIISTTSISNFKYLLAKSLSNFFVLLTIMMIVMFMALVLVFIRGSGFQFDAWQFFSPYIFATIPGLFFLSALAVFAEVSLGRYSILQNIAFFILFIVVVSAVNESSSGSRHWFDVLGTSDITRQMEKNINHLHGESDHRISVGFMFSSGKITIKHFLFDGTVWESGYIMGRLIWMGLSFVLILISSFIFSRFDVKTRVKERKRKSGPVALEVSSMTKKLHPEKMPVATTSYAILPFVKMELRMLVRKGPTWFWLINAGCFIALFFIPLTSAHQIGLPVLWFLQINRWADLVTKDKYYRTHFFTYAAYKPLQRLLTSQILAGVFLAFTLAVPVMLRYAIGGNFTAVVSILFGVLFVVSLAVFSGIITGRKRLFEILFFMLTYANISGASVLDYYGGFNSGSGYQLIIVAIIMAMLITAVFRRNYEISHQ